MFNTTGAGVGNSGTGGGGWGISCVGSGVFGGAGGGDSGDSGGRAGDGDSGDSGVTFFSILTLFRTGMSKFRLLRTSIQFGHSHFLVCMFLHNVLANDF